MKHRLITLITTSLLSSLACAQTSTQSITTPATSTSGTQTTVTTTTTTGNGMVTPTTTVTTNIGDENKRLGEAYLTNNKLQTGIITTPSGLQYKIISKGNGVKPTKNDMVTVNYEGRHIDGRIFDSSYQRGQPATFPLDAVIPGWQEALQLMNVGDTWEIYIPSDLAYGLRGFPPTIAPNETLIFKVNLISTQPKATT